MAGALTNHLWQSTVFALAVGLLALAMRRNGAHVRHWLWVTASIKFILPFALLMSVGSWFAAPSSSPTSAAAATPDFSIAIDQIAQPFSGVFVSVSSVPQAAGVWTVPRVVFITWAIGFLGIAMIRWQGWRHVRTAMRTSTSLVLPSEAAALPRMPVRSSPGTLEPGVVGWWRPVLLVPAGIEEHLTPEQLRAVLAHELCHVRRRDNLTAAIHMVVEAVFWFHPLVWWIGARMVDERERACDEHVLRECGNPQAYAEGILNVCKLYVESPLTCVSGVSGIGSANLKRRIEAIMINHIGVDLNSARKAALVVAAVLALALPVAVGTITAPLRASDLGNQEPAADTQKFEVASIKPCIPEPVPPGGRTGGGGSGSFSPGRAYLSCFVVKNLIDAAYVGNRAPKVPDDPLNNWPAGRLIVDPTGPQRVRGGPDWIYKDKYTIEAKAPGTFTTTSTPGSPERIAMMGPMLRNLLADRFHLKVHQETEEVPMWDLVVAKGGLKIKPMKEGECTKDRSNGPILLSDAKKRGVLPTCGTVNGGPDGPNMRYEHGGQTLAIVATMASEDLGVKVLDKTGITDVFSFTWTYGPNEDTPGSTRFLKMYQPSVTAPPTAASIFTALEEQLGLKLVRSRGPRAYLVVDYIERPAPDFAVLAPGRR